jgi:type I restriction enzyme S subunit
MAEFNLHNTVNVDKVFLVKRSELEGRIDPSQYHFERREAITKLKKNNTIIKLKDVVNNEKKITTELSETDVYVGLENIISETGEYMQTNDKSTVSSAGIFNKGQILFPKLRPYLNKVYLAEFDGICSTEFHIFDCKPNYLNEFLAIYLRSSLIVNQTKHLMTGNTLPRLQTEDINNLPVPIISIKEQQKIIDLYQTAYTKKQKKEAQAKELLASIDIYLLNELGITLPEKDTSLQSRIFTTMFSDVSGGRFDPFYNDIFYLEIDKKITNCNYPFKRLKKLCYSVSGVIYSGTDERTEGLPILRGNNISLESNELNFDNIRFIRDDIELSDDLKLKKDDIFMSSASGSKEHVGKVAYIEDDLDYYFGGFMMVLRKRQNDYNQKYFFEFLQSNLFRMYLYKNLGGTNINNLNYNMLSNLKVPFPPPEKQIQIANHIQAIRTKAQQLQEEAKAVLEEAKREVEKMILG